MTQIKNLYSSILKTVFLTIIIFNINTICYGQDTDNIEVSRDAKIVLSFSEEDTIKIITATATDNQGLPIEELDLYFFVKRAFSLLPIGDVFNTTEEDGTISVKFPSDLPGDAEGKVNIIVKILESDDYDDLEVEVTKKWGVPTHFDEKKAQEERSLWADGSKAPIPLVISITLLIIVIWYVIFYIIFKLYRISKIKPLNT